MSSISIDIVTLPVKRLTVRPAMSAAPGGASITITSSWNSNNVAYGVFGIRSRVLADTRAAGFTEGSEQPWSGSTHP